MSLNSEKDKSCKRIKRDVSTTSVGESFSEVKVPLTLPKLPATSLMSNNPSQQLNLPGSDVSVDSGTEQRSNQPYFRDTTYADDICATEVNPDLPTEVSQEPLREYDTGILDNNAELELDFMWNEVYETLISEREECDLRDWDTVVIAEEDEGDFPEYSELTESTPTRMRSTTGEAASKEQANNRDSQPLYPGASITIGAVMVLFSLYAIEYALTGDAISQLLQLMALMLPSGNILPDSLRKFKTFFSNLDTPFVLHHYCAFCLSNVNKDAKSCANPVCLKEFSSKQSKAYFIEIPIVEQLRTLFSRSWFYNDIQHRFKRKKKNANNVEDIYDGALYKSLFNKGILSSPDNISFILNTDGVPVFNSSKISIWPLYLIINELPYNKRMANDNMIFAGLWFGKKKASNVDFSQAIYLLPKVARERCFHGIARKRKVYLQRNFTRLFM